MGLKRKGNSRKKVLNLNEDASSAKLGTWSQAPSSTNLPDGSALGSTDESQAGGQLSSNPLSGLLQHYNSNSEESDEEEDDDPKQENIKISNPFKDPSISRTDGPEQSSTQSSCVWSECFDETLGHPYYWNTMTNAVVWEMPLEYSLFIKEQTKEQLHSDEMLLLNKLKPTPKVPENVFPISADKTSTETQTKCTTFLQKLNTNKSDTISDIHNTETGPPSPKPQPICQTIIIKEEVNPKLQKEVDKKTALVANYGPDSDEETDQHESKVLPTILPITSHPTPSLFLGKDEEKESNDLKRKYSTLLLEESEQLKDEKLMMETKDSTELPSNSKQFKRKRRIDVFAVRNQAVKPKTVELVEPESRILQSDEPNDETEIKPRIGFGFSKQVDESAPVNVQPSGGIQFIKADTINVPEKVSDASTLTSAFRGQNVDKDASIENEAQLITDKLSFLLEGESNCLSTVVALHLQTETLILAWRAGALTHNYLEQRLQEASCELSKQEEGAAPAGWLCCWDRSRKRYVYQNTSTKEIQLEYPETYCKSTKPSEHTVLMPVPTPAPPGLPPLPLASPPRQPSPPCSSPPPSPPPLPPPVSPPQIPPPPPPPPPEISQWDELLPPGVDEIDVTTISPKSNVLMQDEYSVQSTDNVVSSSALLVTNNSADFCAELSSFYSDLADLEPSKTIEEEKPSNDSVITSEPVLELKTETVKLIPKETVAIDASKKKKKSKLSGALSMKKKHVSSLVEKWQKVRKELSDSDDE